MSLFARVVGLREVTSMQDAKTEDEP